MSGSVVVIGSGVVGAMTALELARAGKRVTVVEQKTFGSGCSQGNCGYVCPSHVLPLAVPGALTSTFKTLFQKNSPLKVRPGFLLRNLGWFLGFARKCNRKDMLQAAVGIQALLNSSRALYDEFLAREAILCEWEAQGLFFIFQSHHAFEHYAETDALLREQFQMPAERHDHDSLVSLEPSLKSESVSGGYLYKSDAQLRPDRLMCELHRLLTSMQVTIVENCTVTEFEKRQERAVAVKTNQGEIEADEFVLATGAWAPFFARELGCRIPIIPGKGYSITLDRPALCPKYPLIFEEHRVAVSPFPSGLRIGSTMEFGGYDDTLNPERLKLLRRAAEIYLKDPGTGNRVQNEWWGWRPMIADGKPIIDRSPRCRNVLIAAGHGMLGLSMATGTARLVRELILNQTPHVDPSHYRLHR